MRALKLLWSWAFNLVCEVALNAWASVGKYYGWSGGLMGMLDKIFPARNQAEMAAVAVVSVPCTSSYGKTSTKTASCSRRVRNAVQLSTQGPNLSAECTRLWADFHQISHLQPCGSVICHVKSFGSVVAHVRSGRGVMYDETANYVLMEPGEDEQFVTPEELQSKLKTCLQQWQGKQLPPDLARFKTVEEAVEYLMTSVCELELGDGQGSVQWYEVRLD